MTLLTDDEWQRVQEALVSGGLRECIDDVLSNRVPVQISVRNRRMVETAYDDGDGNTLTLEKTRDHPWFAGMHENDEMMLGLEHEGMLYSITHNSGGGGVSVIVGCGLAENDVGVSFSQICEAKAYVKGLIAK